MSTSRTKSTAGWVNPKTLPRGENGRALCRQCNHEVPKGRRTFCGDACVHEHRLRSDPAYLRREVFKRDEGICADCGIDTKEITTRFLALDYAGRYKFCEEMRLTWEQVHSPWNADHILPVAEGGGECGLENIQTLCIPCHKKATAALRKRLAEQKRKPAALSDQGELPL